MQRASFAAPVDGTSGTNWRNVSRISCTLAYVRPVRGGKERDYGPRRLYSGSGLDGAPVALRNPKSWAGSKVLFAARMHTHAMARRARETA